VALGLAESVRNAWCDNIASLIDSGKGAGRLCIYGGERPDTGGAPTMLLAELTFARPCAESPIRGRMSFKPIASDMDAKADGKATWARAVNSDGEFAADLSVGLEDSDEDVKLKSVKIVKGQIVTVKSATITEGNP
jgi:hypothetical protein